jgi:pyrophosphatase PpaX
MPAETLDENPDKHREPPQFRAVLFDFDGTLADSTELIMRSYRYTMRRHLGHVPPEEEWMAGFGTPLRVQIGRFARSADEHREMLETYRTYQEQHHDDLLRPFPGAAEMVATLARRGVPMAVVTSKYRRSTLRGMELCGILEHVAVIVTPEDVEHPKPHPEPVLQAVARLDQQPGNTVFVGDSPHDIAAGRAAGTWTAAVLWGPFSRASLAAEQPNFLLESQADLLRLVLKGGPHDGPGHEP